MCTCIPTLFLSLICHLSFFFLFLLSDVLSSLDQTEQKAPFFLANANTHFQTALNYWTKVQSKQDFVKDSPDIGFTLFSWCAETKWSGKQYREAYEMTVQSVQFLKDSRIQTQAYNTSRSLYNKGVHLYNQEKHTEAIKWLKLSCEVLDFNQTHNQYKEKQGTTFRVMAMAFLELKQYPQALAAVEQSLSLVRSMESQFVEAKLFYLQKRQTEGEEAVLKAINHNNCSVRMGIALCATAAELSVLDFLNRAFSALKTRFPHDDVLTYHHFKTITEKGSARQALGLLQAIDLDRLEPAIFTEILTVIWNITSAHFQVSWFLLCIYICISLYLSRRAQSSDLLLLYTYIYVYMYIFMFRNVNMPKFELGWLTHYLSSREIRVPITHTSLTESLSE